MNLDKLKEAARKYEQREDWRRAIEVYLQAIREAEEAGGETPQDPGLYNRVGDLQLKAGDVLAALRAYEEAAELYAEQGFFNNAIALCGKILRVNPRRTPTYLRLAHLHTRKNFLGEARKNLFEYLERMNRLGDHEEAFTALRLFADQFSSNPDVRLMLVELLRTSAWTEDAEWQLKTLAAELEARGNPVKGRHSRDPTHELDWDPSSLGRGVAFPSDLVFLDTGLDAVGAAEPLAPVEGLLRSASESLVADPANRDANIHGAEALDATVAARESTAFHQDGSGDPDFELDVGSESEREAGGVGGPGIITADSAGPTPTAAAEKRLRARELLEVGHQTSGIRALEAALSHLEAEARWEEALEIAGELIRLESAAIPRYQKRVELAYHFGRRPALVAAYLDLAGALLKAGAPEHAAQVYRRVLVHDGDNRAAQAGLQTIAAPPESAAPAPPPAAPAGEFIDLGALILGTAPRGDTRIRVGERAPIEDEDRVFQEALADFKHGLENRLDPDDFQSHYDLGIAFKEMGLMDEAIAQFQQALRAPHAGLKASEQLGIAFYEQGQPGIAEAVLRRAVNGLAGAEDEKIGVLYWLGRALEAQGRGREALPLYEQALALDIRFLDVRDRIGRLAAELRL